MMKNLIEKYLQPKEIYGIELIENNIINVALVNKKKELINYWTNKSMDDLSKSIPIVLSINNSNSIQRIVANDIPIEKAINRILPSAKIEDFLFQEKSIGNNEKTISIIRHKLLEDHIHYFETNNFQIIRIFLNDIVKKDYDKKSIAESTALSYWDNKKSLQLSRNTENKLMHKKAFDILSKTLALVFFIALLVNFTLYNHYNKQEIQLESKLSKYRQILNQEEKLKQQLEKQKQFASNQTKLSYYADQIASTIPKNIQLLKLEILKDEYNLPNNKHNILIKGTGTAKNLSQWIKTLYKKPFIESIEIEDFETKTFELTILIYED